MSTNEDLDLIVSVRHVIELRKIWISYTQDEFDDVNETHLSFLYHTNLIMIRQRKKS